MAISITIRQIMADEKCAGQEVSHTPSGASRDRGRSGYLNRLMPHFSERDQAGLMSAMPAKAVRKRSSPEVWVGADS
jgi:hypothetical protein